MSLSKKSFCCLKKKKILQKKSKYLNVLFESGFYIMYKIEKIQANGYDFIYLFYINK